MKNDEMFNSLLKAVSSQEEGRVNLYDLDPETFFPRIKNTRAEKILKAVATSDLKFINISGPLQGGNSLTYEEFLTAVRGLRDPKALAQWKERILGEAREAGKESAYNGSFGVLEEALNELNIPDRGSLDAGSEDAAMVGEKKSRREILRQALAVGGIAGILISKAVIPKSLVPEEVLNNIMFKDGFVVEIGDVFRLNTKKEMDIKMNNGEPVTMAMQRTPPNSDKVFDIRTVKVVGITKFLNGQVGITLENFDEEGSSIGLWEPESLDDLYSPASENAPEWAKDRQPRQEVRFRDGFIVRVGDIFNYKNTIVKIIAIEKNPGDHFQHPHDYLVLEDVSTGPTQGEAYRYTYRVFYGSGTYREEYPQSFKISLNQAEIARPVGGIDLDPAMLDLQIKRDGNGIPLPLSQQPIGERKIEGVFPIFIRMIPISIPQLLGQAAVTRPEV